jgi:flagellar L-ring protein precursor FlgH
MMAGDLVAQTSGLLHRVHIGNASYPARQVPVRTAQFPTRGQPVYPPGQPSRQYQTQPYEQLPPPGYGNPLPYQQNQNQPYIGGQNRAGLPAAIRPGRLLPGQQPPNQLAPGQRLPNQLAPGQLRHGLSWIRHEPTVPHIWQENEFLMVIVDEKAFTTAEGEVQRRKNALYDAVLEDFVILNPFRWIKPSPQSDGDPRIKGQVQQQYRAENEMETTESVKLNVAVHIADIRPNGNLVLEGHKVIEINQEVWEVSLTGICAPDAVNANRTVLSERIVDLQLKKRERGHVYDAYKRGWFTRMLDRLDPF